MRNKNLFAKFCIWRGMHIFILVLGTLVFLLTIATLSNFYSPSSDTLGNPVITERRRGNETDANKNVETVIRKIQEEMRWMKELADHDSSSLRYSAFLADILGLVELVQASLPQRGQQEQDGLKEEVHPLARHRKDDPANYFLIEEIRKYVGIKPNRLGKQNFMGANGTFSSIGHACFSMKNDLEEYMDYDVGDICKDDWKLAQKLMVHGCDPLPRRRCFSKAPKLYRKPFPINESMWKIPDDRNVTFAFASIKRKKFWKLPKIQSLSSNNPPISKSRA